MTQFPHCRAHDANTGVTAAPTRAHARVAKWYRVPHTGVSHRWVPRAPGVSLRCVRGLGARATLTQTSKCPVPVIHLSSRPQKKMGSPSDVANAPAPVPIPDAQAAAVAAAIADAMEENKRIPMEAPLLPPYDAARGAVNIHARLLEGVRGTRGREGERLPAELPADGAEFDEDAFTFILFCALQERMPSFAALRHALWRIREADRDRNEFGLMDLPFGEESLLCFFEAREHCYNEDSNHVCWSQLPSELRGKERENILMQWNMFKDRIWRTPSNGNAALRVKIHTAWRAAVDAQRDALAHFDSVVTAVDRAFAAFPDIPCEPCEDEECAMGSEDDAESDGDDEGNDADARIARLGAAAPAEDDSVYSDLETEGADAETRLAQ